MVKIRDKKFGKVTDVAASYAGILCKLGKHEYVVDELSAAGKAMVKELATAIRSQDDRFFTDTIGAVSGISPASISTSVVDVTEVPTIAPVYKTRAIVPEGDDDLPDKPKRKYTRRDLSAED
jgi:hypothetical protein